MLDIPKKQKKPYFYYAIKAESRVVLCILEVMSLGKVVMSLVSILILLYNIQNVESMFTKNPQ